MLMVAAACLLPVSVPAQQSLEKGWIGVSRTIFGNPADRRRRALKPNKEVELRDEFWQSPPALRLRVESIDPEAVVVIRFSPKDKKAGSLVLTLIVVSRERLLDFNYQQESQALEGGSMVVHRRFRVREGIATDLAGQPGEVEEIRIQDDATAELRLLLRDGELLLRLIPVDDGGNASGNVLPIYYGGQLRFLDYTLLGAGWTDNGYGEMVLFEDFALMGNILADGGNSVLLLRGVVRQQVVRWHRVSITVEGGAAFFTLTPADASVENAEEPTVVGGATLHFRSGDWGGAAHASTVNGPILMMLFGSWQITNSFGGLVEYQSFEGFTGFGVGLSLLF
ncbi:MAG: hypothetical protein O7G32_08120 [SAR324 cluster bacterium]|nr:hypothetical protein [SAR324 cluster bacterium]